MLNKYLLSARAPLDADETVVMCMVCLGNYVYKKEKQIYSSSQVAPRALFATSWNGERLLVRPVY